MIKEGQPTSITITDANGNISTLEQWLHQKKKVEVKSETVVEFKSQKALYIPYTRPLTLDIKKPSGVLRTKVFTDLEKEKYIMSQRAEVFEAVFVMQGGINKDWNVETIVDYTGMKRSSVSSMISNFWKVGVDNDLIVRKRLPGQREFLYSLTKKSLELGAKRLAFECLELERLAKAVERERAKAEEAKMTSKEPREQQEQKQTAFERHELWLTDFVAKLIKSKAEDLKVHVDVTIKIGWAKD